jgi:hypothetical protein
MKTLLAAVAVLALAPASALAADGTVAWKVNGAFGDAITYTITCTLTQTGDALAGPCTDPAGGANVQATGKADGTTVEFAYDTTYQGSPVHLDYKGDVQPDGSLKGVIDAGGPEGTFTATKQ